MTQSRRNLVVQRWSNLGAYGVVASALPIVIAPRLLTTLALQSTAWHVDAWANYGLAVIISSAVVRASWSRPGAFWGTRHFWSYPPLWMGGFFGALASCVGWLVVPGAWSAVDRVTSVAPSVASAVGPLVACVCIMLVPFLRDRMKRRAAKPAQLAGAGAPSVPLTAKALDFDTLVTKLEHDEPVADSTDDWFNHAAIADRIARRLLGREFNERSSVAVLGELGSGKTTILRLVEDAFSKEEDAPRVVSVSLWPYETSEAAVQGLLSMLVQSAASEVNVVALAGVPREYRQVADGMGGAFARVSSFFGAQTDPALVLKRIDDIAGATGLRFVLWVEDLERFAAPDSSREDRVAPVRALLHLIDDLQHIVVVSSSTTLHLRFDLEKIARYVETVPPIDPDLANKIFRCFRDGCLYKMGAFIDPVPRASDFEFHESDPAITRMFGGRNREHPKWGEAIVVLAKTPRRLKQALRRCYEAWDALRGEIDFDDLLVMSVLREAEPEVFALVDEFRDDLRVGEAVRRRIGRADSSPFDEALDALLVHSGKPIDVARNAAINKVIDHVFGGRGSRGEQLRRAPQGLSITRGADYWQRFQTLASVPESESDQLVLRCMRTRDFARLVALLEDEQRHASVEHFSFILDDDSVFTLFQVLIAARIPEDGRAWTRQDPPGLVPIWRIMNHRDFKSKNVASRLESLLKEFFQQAVGQNLVLLYQLEHYFVLSSDSVPNLLDHNNPSLRQTMRDFMREVLVTEYSGHPDHLATQLKGAATFLLRNLCCGIDRARESDFQGTPFARWDEFAQTVLEAGRRHPETMLPAIAWLIVQELPIHNGETTVAYDQNADERLFGPTQPAIALFSGPALPERESEIAYHAVRSAALTRSTS